MFLVIGTILCWGFLPVRWLDERRIEKGPSVTVMGRILEVEDTNMEMNHNRVWKHKFRYQTADGKIRHGEAFLTGKKWKENARVKVRHLVDEPDTAKVVGARMEASPPWLAFVLLFPLAGAAVIFGWFWSRASKMRLLREGVVSSARIESIDTTSMSVNGTNVRKIRLSIPEAGEVVRKTWDDVEIELLSEKKEKGGSLAVLLDPRKPKRMIFPDAWEDGAGVVDVESLAGIIPGEGGTPPKLRDEVEAFLGMPTPRRIPRWLGKEFSPGFGGWFLRLFGLIFLSMGLFFSWMFVPWHLPKQWMLDAGDHASAQGTITELVNPRMEINGEKVMGYRFSFRPENGSEVQGLGYTDGERWAVGNTVPVSYLRSDPRIAVPDGARLGPSSLGAMFVILFPIIGASVLFIPMMFQRRKKKILISGRVGAVKVADVRKTNVSIDRQPQHVVRMIRDDGTSLEKKTHQPGEVALVKEKARSREWMTILHDPMKPDRLLFPEAW